MKIFASSPAVAIAPARPVLGRLATALAPLLLALTVFSGCGSDDPGVAKKTCSADGDCSVGQVCLLATNSCGTVPCESDGFYNCLPDQICLTLEDGSAVCSRPACVSNDECTAPAVCSGGKCVEETCTSKDDCPDGKICNLNGACVDPPAECGTDDQCPSGQVCVIRDGAANVCRPGCAADTDCEAGRYCNTADKQCQPGCRSNDECGEGETCDLAGTHQCGCEATSCPQGKVCDPTSKKCIEQTATSCADLNCDSSQGLYCDQPTLTCVQGCVPAAGTPNSCPDGEFCDQNTGSCVSNSCPGEDPNQCQGDPDFPLWNATFCACVECLGDTDCDQGAGETCNANGQCFACTTACGSAAGAQSCGGATPYCVSDCCVECVGAADCPSGQICLDGSCGNPPSCANDPTVCPTGYTCNAGVCQPPATGGTCDPQNPTSCPTGTFCDPTTGTCQGAGGGFGCGLCNADCTCDNGLSCDGFLCGGCTTQIGFPPTSNCPSGQVCLDIIGEPVCFPNPF